MSQVIPKKWKNITSLFSRAEKDLFFLNRRKTCGSLILSALIPGLGSQDPRVGGGGGELPYIDCICMCDPKGDRF